MASGESRKLFQKALYLAIAFIVVLIVANNLLKYVTHSIGNQKTAIDAGNANFVVIKDEEKNAIKEKIAGFWQCNAIKSVRYPFLDVSDRFELKINGIFWSVKHTTIRLASGDSSEFVSILTGYMNPFSRSKTCPDSMIFQVHFFGQVTIANQDTCYVEHERQSGDAKKSILPDILRTPPKEKDEGVVDTIWDVVANGKVFDLGKTTYSAYDTSHGGLSSFFPKGAVKLVGKISVPQCPNSLFLENVTKDALKRDFSSISVASRDAEDVKKTIQTYYRAMFAENLAQRVTVYKKGSITFSIYVDKHGKVSEPKIVESKPLNMRLNNDLKQELLTWIFPVCASQDAPVRVTFSFEY